jgi:SAM-dependent methyltransferase
MTDPKRQTIDVYDRQAAAYADLVAEDDVAGLAQFLAALPAGGRVLDLGCGPGLHGAAMQAAGFRVLAVDASGEMCALAQGRGLETRQADFDAIASLPGPFDGIWASFSLLHAPKAALPRHLAELHALVAPGATLVLGMKTGTGEATDGIGRFYAYYSEAELRGLLDAAGFRPGAALHGEGKGLSGSVDPWIVLFATA